MNEAGWRRPAPTRAEADPQSAIFFHRLRGLGLLFRSEQRPHRAHMMCRALATEQQLSNTQALFVRKMKKGEYFCTGGESLPSSVARCDTNRGQESKLS